MVQDEIYIQAPADFHVHVRQGEMMELVVPHVYAGGIRTAYVMPNTIPPITTTQAALNYREQLEKLAPEVEWLMTLYLHPDVTPEEIRKASKAGIKGVKSYPKGVTTNSGSGIESYDVYYPVFKVMEEENMVLNLHGEVPSDPEKNISTLNSEKHFLSHLIKLSQDFPSLRIVLEHATTSEAVSTVLSLPSTIGCSITAHHLFLTIDDVAPQPFHFCKPIAKEPVDRKALRDVVKSGNEKFFLGSDSAPHPLLAKIPALAFASRLNTTLDVSSNMEVSSIIPTTSSRHKSVRNEKNIEKKDIRVVREENHQGHGEHDGFKEEEEEERREHPSCAAGVYTSKYLIPVVATLLESFGALDQLEKFVSLNGRKFYEVPINEEKSLNGNHNEVKLKRSEFKVPSMIRGENVEVIPFWAGKQLSWEIVS
ncbi:hypothetical protein TREMEDRAFT_73620 [Tremella mesenterica DSM 1558]|uniref:uncharacterized protein n=1 Tax=Tremella mesenterica (strain ATCC 24925 / CBS 8224 / DSM 1558 / NBRC 9311 / NRRL Y-6157 / RJB 2259-6 / UBC 559-6) TaxID=578456 RepID=UPI0003F491FA|nr:uncharacterized protein TREMEDRAFT_73620 [Tremella mesenterica DSM 1558]EIW69799.1 hypothetical protein TREMEDRAFT_73620 [Tremella mesenterica DSM 1558]